MRITRIHTVSLVVALAVAAAILAVVLGGGGNGQPRSRGQPAVVPTASPTASVSCEPPSTRLSFISTRVGGHEIHVLDIRRPAMVTRVTNLAGMVGDPAWSPDGRRFAFRWFRQGSVGMYVADADGSNVRLLVDGGVTPDWSPDGRQIVYARPGGALWLVDVDRALRGDQDAARLLIRTSEDRTQMEYPSWSRDGKRILFAGYRPSSFDIWVADADGTDLLDLTPQSSLEYGASWSPDGTQVVFGSNRDADNQEGGDLYVVNSDGTNQRRLTTSTMGGNYGPSWSPDGRWIAFNSNRDGNTELYLMRPDGTDHRRLTSDPQEDIAPVWVGTCRGD